MVRPNVGFMKMPSEWLTEERQLLVTDGYARVTAPVVLWGCLGALSGGLATRARGAISWPRPSRGLRSA